MEFQSGAMQDIDFAKSIAGETQSRLSELDELQLALVGGGMADVVVR